MVGRNSDARVALAGDLACIACKSIMATGTVTMVAATPSHSFLRRRGVDSTSTGVEYSVLMLTQGTNK